MGRYDLPPNLPRLVERLRDLGEQIPDNPTAEQAASAINALLAAGAVCSRVVIDGKAKCFRFFEMWQAIYGEKWKQPAQLLREKTKA